MFVKSSRETEIVDELRAAYPFSLAVFGFFVQTRFLWPVFVTRDRTFQSLISITLIVSRHLAMLDSIFSFLYSNSGSSYAMFTQANQQQSCFSVSMIGLSLMNMLVDMWKKLFSASSFFLSSLRLRHLSPSSSIACCIFRRSNSFKRPLDEFPVARLGSYSQLLLISRICSYRLSFSSFAARIFAFYSDNWSLSHQISS